MKITVKLGVSSLPGSKVKTEDIPLGFFVSGVAGDRKLRYRHKNGVLTFETNAAYPAVEAGLGNSWTDPVPVNVTLVVE